MTSPSYGAVELWGGPRGPEIADADGGQLLHLVLKPTIMGTSNPSHLRANLAAEKGLLPTEAYALATRRLAAAGSVPANGE